MSAASRCRVAVYGEVDPNLVDGSSVWLQSVCQVLASLEGVEVTLLLRRPLDPERLFLLDALEADRGVEVLDAGRPGLLGPAEALDLLEDLDRERGRFDLVLLRGQALLAEVAERGSFDGRLWSYAMTGRGMPDATLRALASRSARLLCQTEAVAAELRRIVPEANGSLLLLPPMIPDFAPPPQRSGGERPLRLVYSGKLAPEYCWLETVAAFRRLREARPDAELHVLGDKVYRPPEHPDFHEQATRALHETGGLQWHGAVPRSAVHGLLAECDLALSIRDPGVESAREISTKVLEYGAAGLPVVLNRAPAYERLLGKDYPLFLDHPADAAELLAGPAVDPAIRAVAAEACNTASREFTFSRVASSLAAQLPPAPVAAHPTSTPLQGGESRMRSSNGTLPAVRVLVAGHDLKFLGPVREAVAAAGATLAEDVWHSHTGHDERASRALLEQAGVVLCEWCLGNAAWYSRNVRPDQRLVVRMHRMEVYTDHPAAVEIDNVDRVVCVSRHIADEAAERFGWDPAKLCVIPNSVDVDRFRLPKRDGARFTLAMIGYVPQRKRLDRALDVIEGLRRKEPRFRLILVGHPPSEFDWVVDRPDEVEFFRRCYARIQASDDLRGGVTFLPFTEDLPSIFQKAGFVLSTSESEGHQVSLAEGAASGAVPVVVDRPGAGEQYPSRWVHAGAGEAVAGVLVLDASEDLEREAAAAVRHASGWSPQEILPQWRGLLGLESPQVCRSQPSSRDREANDVLGTLLAAGEFSHRGRRYPIAHSTSPEICRRYADLIARHKIERVLEIGTLFGFSTLFLAGALAETGGKLDTIDIRFPKRTWSDGQEIEDIHEVAERLIAEAGMDDRVTFHEGDSNGVLARLIEAGRRYGFALIDGSHRFEVALLDFVGVDRMLDVGGYLAMDDVGANVSSKEGLSGGPNRVLRSVLATNRYEVELWSANVAVCKKLRDA
jgi:glycosyltransferase involved in cell wall biosynthesis/predicted O-methyltransferase YrrM